MAELAEMYRAGELNMESVRGYGRDLQTDLLGYLQAAAELDQLLADLEEPS